MDLPRSGGNKGALATFFDFLDSAWCLQEKLLQILNEEERALQPSLLLKKERLV